VAAEALEQSVLESKDKEQLLAIAQALGIKTTARSAKATLIQKILDTTGGGTPEPAAPAAPAQAPAAEVPAPSSNGEATPPAAAATVPAVVLGPDGEPLPEWEVALMSSGDAPAAETPAPTDEADGADGDADGEGDGEGDLDGDGESRSARRRRRRRNRNRPDGPQGSDRPDRGDRPDRPERNYDRGNDRSNDRNYDRGADRAADRGEGEAAPSTEPIEVSGYLDLRDEGYGFLRVKGYLPSKEDAYIPVKLTRQYGLRKGDHVTGTVRPAARNEKNPAVLEIFTVNGDSPEHAKGRKRFEDLTALFPDEKLHLSNPTDPGDMTARIIDLISPIGKGQRGIIVSPPKAGKTTVMKTIASAIERNYPEVTLIVLLLDERPEEVTDMRRTVKGEVISSTFDRPSDEHTHVAELAIEKAKRMVEMGKDVVIILDGITRLSRAYNLAAPASGRILSGGIDAGALYPPKKFFGAARNIEEGGSLTILATALVETNSRMDDAIFEEFKGTGNMELRLDRKLAERRIYPAIDVDASSTRHEELLFDRKQLQMVWKLRRVLSGLAADGNAAPGLELLVDRLKTFRTNDEFLNEIAKQPSM
jgi:transcription termination factor Rho